MTEATTPPTTHEPSDEDEELFDRLYERYQDTDEEVARICELARQSFASDSEEAN
ncbi:kinesin [Halobaculum sp. CBA1158]|uniref:kinesin n=1 Tax=Halobaculum sp. CBA1158 TaxID=2904243 RepID=UPI001F343EF4|nr:kinesin [Halobaculum sp. CBA1158]UIP00304.1 kinesin [Halobaculum sp. CBA1158]